MIEITEAGAGDIREMSAFLRALWEAAGPNAPGLTGATDEVIAEISSADALRARLGGPERRIYLARRAGELVGFAATRHHDETTLELSGIMVLPDHQGGVGTPLLEAAADTARKAGYHRLLVRTEVDNAGALAFYRKRGFAPLRRTVESVEGTEIQVWELALEL